jgi:hypothetical protein
MESNPDFESCWNTYLNCYRPAKIWHADQNLTTKVILGKIDDPDTFLFFVLMWEFIVFFG